ncbi:hypothetical protein FACS1894190_09420 [Spirochaetia bacterium]|nr:hypothetical protein FACS1894190_09420 [Spirochaetia bacterium]
MEVSVAGRVNNINLPDKKVLLPVFEAIINSIQACANAGNSSNIDLLIKRHYDQPSLSSDINFLPEISSFTIKDNGCGFNTENFNSFNKSDSLNKAEIGGKGIGRFLWLKVFGNIKIDSVFSENNKIQHRTFTFSVKDDGISNNKLKDVVTSTPINTEVHLSDIYEKYRKIIPKETSVIVKALFGYCLSYFIAGLKINITVSDDYNKSEKYNLFDMYKREIKNNIIKESLVIKSNPLDAFIIKYPTTNGFNHRIVYCAHNREVKIEKIVKYMPIISQRLIDNDKNEYIVIAYVIGKCLDDMVNQERTHFIFDINEIDDDENSEEKQEDLDNINIITLRDIRQSIIPLVNKHVEDNLKEIKENHIKKIEKIINDNSPEYRSVIKYCKDDILKIPPSLSTEKTEIELHKIMHRLEIDLKEKSSKILKVSPSTEQEIADYNTEYIKVAEQTSDIGIDKLVFCPNQMA